MSDRVKENVIEWIEGDKVASFTFSQKRFINRVRKLAEKYGDDVRILKENADGSIFGHISLSGVRLQFQTQNTTVMKGFFGRKADDGKDDEGNL